MSEECFAWEVEFQSSDIHKFHSINPGRYAMGSHMTAAIVGTEKQVRESAREFARKNGIKKWSCSPRPEFNSKHAGKMERLGPSFSLIKLDRVKWSKEEGRPL